MARELRLVKAENGQAIVKITCPTSEVAERIATVLVERRLAACVNILPGVTSIYQWQGEICRDSETLLLVKTADERAEEILEVLVAEHPYEVPEALWTPVVYGSESYLDWMTESMKRA